MIEATQMLRSYLRGIRHLSGADSVWLFVPAPLSGLSEPLLLGSGDAPPPPELADLDTAEAFAAGAAVTATGAAGDAEPRLTSGGEDGTALVPLPSGDSAWVGSPGAESARGEAGGEAGRRRSDVAPAAGSGRPAAWLGLRYLDGGAAADRLGAQKLQQRLEDAGRVERWWDWLFTLGGAMASHTSQVASVLRDPITGLPDRVGLQASLSEHMERSRLDGRPLSVLLLNPDDFAVVNENFGREAGDRIIRQMSRRMRRALRSSDPVARYGGVIFAAILADSTVEMARPVAAKILEQLTEGAYLEGAVRLGFSIGIAVYQPAAEASVEPLELIRRADQALNTAKRLGGGCIVEWEERSVVEETGAFDRLSGIFTGNMTRDYRNMMLLTDAIEVIAREQEFDGLAAEVVERLYAAFKPDRVALYRRDEEGDLRLIRGLTRRRGGSGAQKRIQTVELDYERRELLKVAIAAGEPRVLEPEGEGGTCYAIPLSASGAAVGGLYLEGRADGLELEVSDLRFLEALAAQLAVALDRARLAELDRQRQEREKKKLRAELNELRQALQQAKLVYRSSEIENLVATARRVAPTDATVLITGESGTGKELLARTVHELSPRRDKPMVVVDCGAIATTLIESELFGHEKGAYTGAQQRRAGRLAEANGGTVMLDEIGELPLEVQSKLLRFVQEKQFITVGGTRPQRVDVRILAATNRDLSLEVQAGRFREDLFHRLNVVRLEVPPLRERPEDVIHLARHFLERYSIQYHKSIRRLTPEAERALTAYGWPGNVRELQNRLMQAVILCEVENLGVEQLQLPEQPAAAPVPAAPAASPAADDGEPEAAEPPLETLRHALGRQIDLALEAGGEGAYPLGRWLGEDLVLGAHEAAAGVARQGAGLLSIPETTFRRRLRKASQQVQAGFSPRTGTWDEVRSAVAGLIRGAPEAGDEDLLWQAERVLLEEILERVPGDTRRGSQLLGVTPPTFRSRLQRLRAASGT